MTRHIAFSAHQPAPYRRYLSISIFHNAETEVAIAKGKHVTHFKDFLSLFDFQKMRLHVIMWLNLENTPAAFSPEKGFLTIFIIYYFHLFKNNMIFFSAEHDDRLILHEKFLLFFSKIPFYFISPSKHLIRTRHTHAHDFHIQFLLIHIPKYFVEGINDRCYYEFYRKNCRKS